jgi:hypothetical protein
MLLVSPTQVHTYLQLRDGTDFMSMAQDLAESVTTKFLSLIDGDIEAGVSTAVYKTSSYQSLVRNGEMPLVIKSPFAIKDENFLVEYGYDYQFTDPKQVEDFFYNETTNTLIIFGEYEFVRVTYSNGLKEPSTPLLEGETAGVYSNVPKDLVQGLLELASLDYKKRSCSADDLLTLDRAQNHLLMKLTSIIPITANKIRPL